jgi:cephalosporin-C deacetylase
MTAILRHPFPFDPTYGYDGLDALKAVPVPEAPRDFANFWEARYAAARRIDPKAEVSSDGWWLENHLVRTVRFSTTRDYTLSGWLVTPRAEPIHRLAVVGHGYGSCPSPTEIPPLRETAFLYPCFRGLGPSATDALPSDPAQHVVAGIEDRETYVIGGCVEDVWCGVSALTGLFPEAAENVVFLGVSFSGGLGALAAPWDERIKRVHLEVPTFGQQPMRLELPGVGSAAGLQAYARDVAKEPLLDTLQYFDAAIAARFLTVPVHYANALFDPVVPPPTQFAVYNGTPRSIRSLTVLTAGHFEYPRQAAEQDALRTTIAEFFGR